MRVWSIWSYKNTAFLKELFSKIIEYVILEQVHCRSIPIWQALPCVTLTLYILALLELRHDCNSAVAMVCTAFQLNICSFQLLLWLLGLNTSVCCASWAQMGSLQQLVHGFFPIAVVECRGASCRTGHQMFADVCYTYNRWRLFFEMDKDLSYACWRSPGNINLYCVSCSSAVAFVIPLIAHRGSANSPDSQLLCLFFTV